MEDPSMEAWMLQMTAAYGCFGVFLLILTENVFPPIPGEAVLLFAGALGAETGVSWLEMTLAAAAGSLAGALILYGAGALMGNDRLYRLLSGRMGTIFRLKPSHLQKAEKWFRKYDWQAVLFCRFVPVLRSLISVPAGMEKMNLVTFSLLTFAGSMLWDGILIGCGCFLGSAWQSALPVLQQYLWAGAAVCAALAAAAGITIQLKKKKKQLIQIPENMSERV